ncbi:MAG: LysR family transcriptional regulator [Opitutae bacterium]|nr:LysR family transcriptional regulator [Opitutae bacterium]
MELHGLRSFIAVAETLSFPQAAQRLRITSPVLQRRLSGLEEHLGCSLLRRSAARVTLTAAGQVFLTRARELLLAAELAAGEVKAAAQAAADRVHFGHHGALWAGLYAPAIRRFLKRFPGAELQSVEGTPSELIRGLRRGEIDIALLGPVDIALQIEFASRALAAVPAVLALPAKSALARKPRHRLADLAEATWIGWDERHFPGRKRLLLDAAARAGFTPKLRAEANGAAAVLAHVAAGEGIGYMLPFSRRLPHSGVVFAELESPAAIQFEVNAVWRNDAESVRRLETLAELLAATPLAKARAR